MEDLMRLLKILLVPAALAFVPALAAVPAGAAPTSPGGNTATVETGVETTPAYHRGYWHESYYYNYRPYRRHNYSYYYGPRCHWSYYLHRTVCRY